MSYDSALHGLAQRYFIQALSLAQSAGDRLLGASILDAMSHQATFVGRFQEAANLARAAQTGAAGVATPTLKAHFYAMEARALARLPGSANACENALSAAVREYERRNPENDPEWIAYFDDAELAAEMGHCFRDIGRAVPASDYANQCLGTIDDGVYLRSDFFATMVLADSYLGSGEVEQACRVTLDALKLGEQIRSARCVAYLREFSQRLGKIGAASGVSDFEEQARSSRLWRIASQTTSDGQ
jgi:tetratricopeptide (TPR) repeat protein